MEDPPNATLAALTALETKIVESEPVTLEDYKVQALILLSWINDGAPLSRRFDARIAAVYNKRFIPAVRLDQETEGAA